MRTWMAPIALAAACAGGDECEQLADGDWTVDGSAFGMAMGVVVTTEAEGCGFTFSDWNMEMASVPTGGTIDGDQLTLQGDDAFWATCTGTVGSGGKSVEGACDDGSSFTMDAG